MLQYIEHNIKLFRSKIEYDCLHEVEVFRLKVSVFRLQPGLVPRKLIMSFVNILSLIKYELFEDSLVSHSKIRCVRSQIFIYVELLKYFIQEFDVQGNNMSNSGTA